MATSEASTAHERAIEALPLAARDRRRLGAWLLFSVLSLGIAGLLAFGVAAMKTPALRPSVGAETFRTILVGHVTFAITIWCLSFVGVMIVAGGAFGARRRVRGAERLEWLGLAAFAVGSALVLLATVAGLGAPALLDYVPLLLSGTFLGGVAAVLAGGLLAAVAGVLRIARGAVPAGPWRATIAATAATLAIALGTGVLSTVQLVRAHGGLPPLTYQPLVWGFGHVIQYVYVLAMIGAWWALARYGGAWLPRRPWLPAAVAALGIVLAFSTPVGSLLLGADGLRHSLTASVWILSLLAVVAVVAMAALAASRRRGPVPDGSAATVARRALGTSVFLFLVGVLLDPAGRMGTLWVPAHYHGVVVGGITIAFMGLSYALVPACGGRVAWPRAARWQPWVYGLGVAIMIGGLAWAGAEGAVRKDHLNGIVVEASFTPALNLMGLGSVFAVLGGAAFVLNVMVSLLKRAPLPAAAAARAAAARTGASLVAGERV